MKAQFVQGSKQEITEAVAQVAGNILGAIILVEEPASTPPPAPPAPGEDMFAEMEPYTVRAGGQVDYSREALYRRMEGE